MLPGDVLLVTAFISYVGCFMRRYRLLLINEDWIPTLGKTNVSILYQNIKIVRHDEISRSTKATYYNSAQCYAKILGGWLL